MSVRITGVGRALPDRVVTNAEIAERLGVEPSWISTRTGIEERRFAAPDESASTLGADASRAALAVAGLTPTDIDVIVAATVTQDYNFPPTGCVIQDILGAGTIPSFDVNAACSGFIYALKVVDGMAGPGMRRILLVGTEVLSRFTNPDDAMTAPLFGDGAGAVVLEWDPDAAPIGYELGADGAGGRHVLVPAGGGKTPSSPATLAKGLNFIHMAGREVYRNAVLRMSELGRTLGAEGFDLLIAHQANQRILKECADRIGVGMDKVYMNIDRYGNTSAASIPIAMCEAWESGRLTPGMHLLLLAFGAGFTWAGATLDWTLAQPEEATDEPGLE
ncbi:MAG: 3-oxoacyl-ACP synthase III family protein, partial [Actinomycetota bacterium]